MDSVPMTGLNTKLGTHTGSHRLYEVLLERFWITAAGHFPKVVSLPLIKRIWDCPTLSC